MLKQITLMSSVIAGFCLLIGGVHAKPEGTLKFLLQPSSQPNLTDWTQLAQEFADADPAVDTIEFVTDFVDPADEMANVDCGYTFINHVPFIDLSLIQPLDAFLEADTNFDRSDIPEAFWSLVTRNDHVYGLPLTVNPAFIWYDPDAFASANLPIPENGWSADEFLKTLTAVKAVRPGFAYQSRNSDSTFYELMATALGGRPVDYTTYIPTYHLTDPNVIDALRQLLDLAKTGVIHYEKLDNIRSLGITTITRLNVDTVALYDGWGTIFSAQTPDFVPVTFPQGDNVVPMSYNLGSAYIMAATPHAESCYQWLRLVSQHPELFSDMPAQRSQTQNSALIAAQGQSRADAYTALFAQLDNPKAVFTPAGFQTPSLSPASFIMNVWFAQALDAYELKGADLEVSLSESQAKIDAYSACIAQLSPFDNVDTYIKTTQAACLRSADPTLADRFSLP